MLPPVSDQPDFAPRETLRIVQERGEPRRGRAFGHRFLDFEQHHDRLLDIAFLDEEHVVDESRAPSSTMRPGLAHGDAVGDRARAELRRHRL